MSNTTYRQASSESEINVTIDDEDDEIEYNWGLSKYSAVVKPVAVTMAIASFIVVNVRTQAFSGEISKGLSVYTVYGDDPDDSGFDMAWKAILNSLAIVAGVLLMTVIMLILFKYKCMKVLYGMLIFTTISSLSYTFGIIAYIAIVKWNIIIDFPFLLFFLFNFGVGGVISIFGNKAPMIITQSYLVAISVIVCYLLSFFPEWTAWAMLVALAFYDLYAVLTPYGPLKLLIELSESSNERIPGLLYEARVQAPRTNNTTTTDNTSSATRSSIRTALGGSNVNTSTSTSDKSDNEISPATTTTTAAATTTTTTTSTAAATTNSSDTGPALTTDLTTTSSSSSTVTENPALLIELLNVSDRHELGTTKVEDESDTLGNENDSSSNSNGETGADSSRRADQNASSILVDASAGDYDSIKLGLGDFIFYSMLVSKAALFGFTTFAICFIVILFGLIATLMLLQVLEKPLPALPISMLLGVGFYFLARLTTIHLINDASIDGVFV